MNPKKNKIPLGAKRIIIILVVGLLIGSISAVSYTAFQYIYGAMSIKKVLDSNEDEDIPSDVTFEQTKVLENIETDSGVTGAANQAMSSIVSISSTYQETNPYFGTLEQYTGSGSGIIIDKTEDTLSIATNHHVISDSASIAVTFMNGETVEAEVKGTDSISDLALITLSLDKLDKETKDAISVARLGKSGELEEGQRVVAIGNAMGYGQSVTVGYISAINREVTIDGTTMTLLQTDAAINPGNSGGALINMAGEVIGINSAKYSDYRVEGMGFAIPIDSATPILSDLKTKKGIAAGKEGYLGISGSTISETIANAYNAPVGIYVAAVSESGAAKEAGIQMADIITHINGRKVLSIEQLQALVTSYPAGEKITVTFARNTDGFYEERTVTVKLKGADSLNDLQDE